jgi:hypothetical protein
MLHLCATVVGENTATLPGTPATGGGHTSSVHGRLSQTQEFQSQEGEAVRNDDRHMYVAAWKYKEDYEWELHKEELKYDEVKASQRSYK